MIKINYKIAEKDKLENEYWSVIEDLIGDKEKTINDELEEWKTKYNIVNTNGYAYTVNEIVLMDYKKLQDLKNKLDVAFKCRQYESDKYECFYEKNSSIIMKSDWKDYLNEYERMRKRQKDCMRMSARIVDYFNTKVCVYCNRAYIDNREVTGNSTLTKSTAQLDHFFPKEKYPIFALSLYNLVPVCQVCNSKKNKYEKKVSPHDSEFNFSRRIFTYEVDGDFSSDGGIKVRIRDDIDVSLKHDLKKLDIDSAYSNNNDVVWEIIEKKRMYDEYRIKEIIESLNLPYSKTEIERILYGNYINESDYSKRPLAKLVSDIVNELDVDWS